MLTLRAANRSSFRRSAGALAALALIVGACGGDDDDADGEEPETTSLLDTVRERGRLICGVNETLPGFGSTNDAGAYQGFDIDYCKVVAAGILGDSTKIDYKPLTASERFTAVQSGEVDVLIRNTTYTAKRDGAEGLTFLTTTFYDGQGLMVPADTGYTTLEDLDGASICVTPSTTTELNLSAVFQTRGLTYNPVVIATDEELRQKYEAGECEVWTTDASGLTAWKFTIEDEGGKDQFILPEIISKEPLGPAVRDGDTAWAQAVNWTILATIQAWEYGLDSGNIAGYSGDSVDIKRFIGDASVIDGEAENLGLDPKFALNIISQVGNYQEIFVRNVEPLGLTIEGSPNNLWTEGGLLYAPPFR